MTRHGKNCTAGAVYTYHEKKKDTAASGYGTQNIRLSRDAVKDFDCCCLSLQPCHDPVVTPDGYLYEREAILEYILHQKKEIARQMKAYEKQRGARREEQKELQRAAMKDQVRGFLEKEAAIVSRPLNPFTPKTTSGNGPDDTQPGPSTGATGKDKDKALPSFWIPSLTPEAKATKLEKPSRTVTCPMSGKPLRMSDLTPVRFTLLDDSVDRVGLITRSERYVCAVTRDSLSNATPCAVLRPSGSVVTLECVEKLIRKDMVDPVNGEKLTDRDIIVLQRGGTGFAGSGVKLQAEKSRPVIQAVVGGLAAHEHVPVAQDLIFAQTPVLVQVTLVQQVVGLHQWLVLGWGQHPVADLIPIQPPVLVQIPKVPELLPFCLDPGRLLLPRFL